MQSSDIPGKSGRLFAQSAGGAYVRNVPQTTADPGAASFDLGFPPQTFTDEGAGGTPPDGRDFNGILQFLSAWARWQQVGGPVTYDASFQTAIGGYPRGAVVMSATVFGRFWLCTVENNASNPDTGGAGWRLAYAPGGFIGTRIFLTSGTYTPTDGTRAIEVTAVGGGGGGGGAGAMGGGQFGGAGGGGAGGSATSYLTSGFAGQAVVIGAGGAGGVGAALGANGSPSTFMDLEANGGGGGAFAVPTAGGSCQVGGAGGSASGGNRLNNFGAPGASGIAFTNGNQLSGFGGSTNYGGGGASRNANTNPGFSATGAGAGGGGAVGQSGAGPQNGGNGSSGIVIIKEYA